MKTCNNHLDIEGLPVMSFKMCKIVQHHFIIFIHSLIAQNFILLLTHYPFHDHRSAIVILSTNYPWNPQKFVQDMKVHIQDELSKVLRVSQDLFEFKWTIL